MLRYRLLPQSLEAMCLSLAQTSIRADCPSGKVPTTFVLRLISLFSRSSVTSHSFLKLLLLKI